MRASPEPRVAGFLDEIGAEGIGLASITAWEILNGIGQLAPGQRREDLAERFQWLLDDLFEDRIFDWSVANARACALVMEEKRHRGEPLDRHLPDAMLAGTALHHDLAIVTRNEREFRNTGVRGGQPLDGYFSMRQLILLAYSPDRNRWCCRTCRARGLGGAQVVPVGQARGALRGAERRERHRLPSTAAPARSAWIRPVLPPGVLSSL